MEGIQPFEQTSPAVAGASSTLPPFRSAKEFPVTPKPEKLLNFYIQCREALVEANTARSLLKERMARKKEAIAAIRDEISRLEEDLAIEAGTRLKLHAMNEHLVGALREMELMSEEVSATIAAAHTSKRSNLKGIIDQLKALIRKWRSFKSGQRLSIANRLDGAQDNGTNR